MTQLRKDPDAISNYFDELLRGIGKRGSTFTDIDAVTHDKDTGRFLFQEFKQPTERLHPAQAMMLRDLARVPVFTVWLVRRLNAGRIGWIDFHGGRPQHEEIITEREYQARFGSWWATHIDDVAVA